MKNCVIHPGSKIGQGCSIGHFVIIEPDVEIGDNVKLGNFVTLKSGTRIGSNAVLADYVCTTGPCRIGDNVRIRTRSTISRCVVIEDDAFIGAHVVTAHTLHVGSNNTLPTIIGRGAIIGSRSNILAGASIPPHSQIASGSNVIRPLVEAGLYAGNPARRIR